VSAGWTYLRASCRVLRCTARKELRFVVVQQVVVKTQMLVLLCQDGIIGFQSILVEQLLTPDDSFSNQ